MKRCRNCGAVYPDEKTVCLECGEKLPEPMTEEQVDAENAQAEADAAVSKMKYNRGSMGIVARILGVIDFAGALFFLYRGITALGQKNQGETVVFAFAGLLLLVIAGIIFLFPIRVWKADYRRVYDSGKQHPTEDYMMTGKLLAGLFTFIGLFLLYHMIF